MDERKKSGCQIKDLPADLINLTLAFYYVPEKTGLLYDIENIIYARAVFTEVRPQHLKKKKPRVFSFRVNKFNKGGHFLKHKIHDWKYVQWEYNTLLFQDKITNRYFKEHLSNLDQYMRYKKVCSHVNFNYRIDITRFRGETESCSVDFLPHWGCVCNIIEYANLINNYI